MDQRNKKNHTPKPKKNKVKRDQVEQEQNNIKNRNEEQMQQHRLHQQEINCEETRMRERKEANRDYWREAMILSEVIGPPVAKRRRAQRMRKYKRLEN